MSTLDTGYRYTEAAVGALTPLEGIAPLLLRVYLAPVMMQTIPLPGSAAAWVYLSRRSGQRLRRAPNFLVESCLSLGSPPAGSRFR